MLRRVASLVMVTALAGLGAVALGTPAATAAPVTSSNITSPLDGAHYTQTNANPSPGYAIVGTTNGSSTSVDIRCYDGPGLWEGVSLGVPVDASGNFSTTAGDNAGWGTCRLRAVPSGYPNSGDLSSFSGPAITLEGNVTTQVSAGPNGGKTYDYDVFLQNAHAFNDVSDAFAYGLSNSRLSYANGTSSNYLWTSDAALPANEGGSRSFLRVDGRNAYGPRAAYDVLRDSLGFPQVTRTVTRDGATGNFTVHEVDPIVVCPKGTPFPPTSTSCPRLRTAGVRLQRTIFVNDGGRQTHITDVWRSIDGKAHTISAHYDEYVDGTDYTSGVPTQTAVGVKLPWLSTTFKTFTGDALYAGPTSGPVSIFVRDNNAAPDGNTDFPRGAITFNRAPTKVEWKQNNELTLRYEGIAIPAGGKRIIRQTFVMGTTQSVVSAKAAANAKRYR